MQTVSKFVLFTKALTVHETITDQRFNSVTNTEVYSVVSSNWYLQSTRTPF